MNQIPLATAKKNGGCGCGCSTGETPVIDVRDIPKPVRHAAILGALTAVKAGESLILVAPHVPTPLLTLVSRQEGEAVTIEVLAESADEARIQLTRVN